jgi:hypothetical protein
MNINQYINFVKMFFHSATFFLLFQAPSLFRTSHRFGRIQRADLYFFLFFLIFRLIDFEKDHDQQVWIGPERKHSTLKFAPASNSRRSEALVRISPFPA